MKEADPSPTNDSQASESMPQTQNEGLDTRVEQGRFASLRDQLTQNLPSITFNGLSVEDGKERVQAIYGRCEDFLKDASTVVASQAFSIAGHAKEASKTVYDYFTDDEEGTKRVVRAVALGATATAATYGIYRYNKSGENNQDDPDNQPTTELPTTPDNPDAADTAVDDAANTDDTADGDTAAEEQQSESIGDVETASGAKNELDKLVDEIDFEAVNGQKNAVQYLLSLGYNLRQAAIINEKVNGSPEWTSKDPEPGLIKDAKGLTKYAEQEQLRGKALDNRIKRLNKGEDPITVMTSSLLKSVAGPKASSKTKTSAREATREFIKTRKAKVIPWLGRLPLNWQAENEMGPLGRENKRVNKAAYPPETPKKPEPKRKANTEAMPQQPETAKPAESDKAKTATKAATRASQPRSTSTSRVRTSQPAPRPTRIPTTNPRSRTASKPAPRPKRAPSTTPPKTYEYDIPEPGVNI